MLSLSVLLNTQDKAIYVILVVTLSVAFTNVGSSGQSGVGQRDRYSLQHPNVLGTFTRYTEQGGTHPHKVANGRLHGGHRGRQIWNSFPVNFTFFVHYHQMGYLLSHRLQDTFYRFRVKNRHGDYFRPLSQRKISKSPNTQGSFLSSSHCKSLQQSL